MYLPEPNNRPTSRKYKWWIHNKASSKSFRKSSSKKPNELFNKSIVHVVQWELLGEKKRCHINFYHANPIQFKITLKILLQLLLYSAIWLQLRPPKQTYPITIKNHTIEFSSTNVWFYFWITQKNIMIEYEITS